MNAMAGAHKGPNKPIRNLGLWRPIEDAPKDGTRFLFTNGTMVGIGHYVGGIAFAADSWQGERNTEPKYWMPIPTIPQEAK